jgi:hypothetical protein
MQLVSRFGILAAKPWPILDFCKLKDFRVLIRISISFGLLLLELTKNITVKTLMNNIDEKRNSIHK